MLDAPITPIPPISAWQDNNRVFEDEFFLSHENYPFLYEEAIDMRENPLVQLSPKGIALISYLYAKKDHCLKQSLVASTVKSLIHIIQLINNAPIGTMVTVIFQPTDSQTLRRMNLPTFMIHSTVLKIKKAADAMHILNIDSTNNGRYVNVCRVIALHALKTDSAKSKDSPATPLIFYSQNDVLNPWANPDKPQTKFLLRQIDEYHCSIFAIKDARILNHEGDIFDILITTPVKDDLTHLKYEISPKYLKVMQSRLFVDYALKIRKYGNIIVSRTKKTLQEILSKHQKKSYIEHFNEKYNALVKQFIAKNLPRAVKAATVYYDAGEFTLQQLIAIYSPSSPSLLLEMSAELHSSDEPTPSFTPLRRLEHERKKESKKEYKMRSLIKEEPSNEEPSNGEPSRKAPLAYSVKLLS